MSVEMGRLKVEMQQLMPLERSGVSGSLIKIDDTTLNNFLTDEKDKFKFNFDVKEMASETISVKSDGKQIEVQAQKKVSKSQPKTIRISVDTHINCRYHQIQLHLRCHSFRSQN